MTSSMFQYWVGDLPPRALSPNGAHGHWSSTSAARAWYRNICAEVFWDAPEPYAPLERAEVGAIVRVCRLTKDIPYQRRDAYRPLDVPNAISALKPLYDALQDAGIIAGDDCERMALGPHEIERVSRHQDEGVLVTVRALEAAS